MSTSRECEWSLYRVVKKMRMEKKVGAKKISSTWMQTERELLTTRRRNNLWLELIYSSTKSVFLSSKLYTEVPCNIFSSKRVVLRGVQKGLKIIGLF